MKGVAGSESGMMGECWSFFSTVSAALTHGLETKKGAEMNVRTKRQRLELGRCLVFCPDLKGRKDKILK
jgi:hypothetical protein